MTSDNQEKKYFEISVACDYRITDSGETTPYLIYENIGPDHKIYMSRDFDGILFKRNAEKSALDFMFTGANILPTINGNNIYPDLKIAMILEDLVCINDHQLNTNQEMVGNITLFFVLRDTSTGLDSNTQKLRSFYSSDPEVINTGVLP